VQLDLDDDVLAAPKEERLGGCHPVVIPFERRLVSGLTTRSMR
jgi:hypothetical protein